ncbi:MAG: response regulator [Thermoguttaceae bacterium]|jgi:DNA-binding response OmpR family regulator
MAKVLIVDDAADTVKLLAYALKNQGYDVSAAYSGREALEIAAIQRPDVILLDVMMPGMNGIEVCRRLKADAALRMIPVLLVTAKELDEDVIAGLDAGAEDYVTKPFNNLVLAARLRAAIRVKQFHDEIAQVNERLRAEIVERKLAEENLRKKDGQLREAQKLEAVGLLAGGIAHEFNNLLQVIGGYTTCAMEDLSPQEHRYEDLQQVRTAAERAAVLTRQLLGFSRRRMLQPENVDPNQLVADVAKMLHPLVGDRISVKIVLRKDIGTVYADPGELQQALLNLCLNARDAMPSGGTLLLNTDTVILDEPIAEPGFQIERGRYMVFGVTDTGQGISAEVQQHIFEPFFTTKEVGKGTGLGLAMVYGVVQQHKGAIHVYSEPGKGTAFKVYLPSGSKNREEGETEKPVPALRGRETILVAEDETMVRSLAVRILEKGGYSVLAASDGAEALRLFKENRNHISLTLLDAIMPKLTGHEVYRHIKAECPQAKVLFASGYDSETAQSGFILRERLRFVGKPFDADTLLRTVREVLDEDHAGTGLPVGALSTNTERPFFLLAKTK